MTLNPAQFGGDPRDVPEPFGATPIPKGALRFNHYTSEDAIEGIKSQGLLRSKSEEKFARGGTESPQVFATAGPPSRDMLNSRPIVEGWADPSPTKPGDRGRQGVLDIGSNWRGEAPEEHAKYLESHGSTITFHNDVPKNQIVAVHEPWHSHARYLQEDAGGRVYNGKQFDSMRKVVARGEHDNLYDEPGYAKALNATKITNAATVMLGGKL